MGYKNGRGQSGLGFGVWVWVSASSNSLRVDRHIRTAESLVLASQIITPIKRARARRNTQYPCVPEVEGEAFRVSYTQSRRVKENNSRPHGPVHFHLIRRDSVRIRRRKVRLRAKTRKAPFPIYTKLRKCMISPRSCRPQSYYWANEACCQV